METAGRQSAMILHHLFPRGNIAVFAGGGNNGGDGLVCARTLHSWGREVLIVGVGSRRDASCDPLLHGWELPFARLDDPRVGCSGLFVDACLGTGLRGAPKGEVREAIRTIRSSKGRVAALDSPSGVDGETGEIPGEVARADLTITYGFPKLGMMLQPGRDACGRIVAVEIGFPDPMHDRVAPEALEWAQMLTAGWSHGVAPARSPLDHKNSAGRALIAAGGRYPGAAVLAAKAALRSGAGVVRVLAPKALRDPILANAPEALVIDQADEAQAIAAVEASDAIAAGPGMGVSEEARALLELILQRANDRPCVLDADALTILAAKGLSGIGRREKTPLLLTPHPGEMARLLGASPEAVQRSRVSSARRLAKELDVVVALKGTPALVAAPRGGLYVSSLEEPSRLASAGMGDVLAGVACAFLARTRERAQDPQRLVQCAGAALETMGRAAILARAGSVGTTALDVAEAMPNALHGAAPKVSDLPFPFVTFDQKRPS